jgi:hypothetical protein
VGKYVYPVGLVEQIFMRGTGAMLRMAHAHGIKVGPKYARVAVEHGNLDVLDALYEIKKFKNKECVVAARRIAETSYGDRVFAWLRARGFEI